ncbi:hypothetical protein K438DRAFT_1982973 [Mycena galopus ATCC 62051]|nr:hypothetical protein K438DRAFT_1982973 [Mycena galopus ATCC 62051]
MDIVTRSHVTTRLAPNFHSLKLEREIFELAASIDVATALRLTVVARRVQVWVEPIIYSTVVVAHAPEVSAQTQYSRTILNSGRAPRSMSSRKASTSQLSQIPRFIRTIPFRPTSFFARHVKCLRVGNLNESELVTVMSTCTGISDLGWWSSAITPPVAAAFDALTLRRLAVDASFKFEPALPPLARFPALTHFSVAHDATVPPSWFDNILKSCPKLHILLRLSDNSFFEELSGLRPRHADLRVVVMQQPVGAWTARWVHDVWPLAENIVRERRELAAAEAANAIAGKYF